MFVCPIYFNDANNIDEMSIRVEYYKISCVYNQYPMYPNTAEKREKININPKILINRKFGMSV